MQDIKAIGLISGGLDSALAVYIIKELGVNVHAVSFQSDFFNSKQASELAQSLEVSFESIAIHEEMLSIVKCPKFGYGGGMNPCIDCHVLMLKKAAELMKQQSYDFVFTGEVLGQRPMSQNKQSLSLICRKSNLQGYLLRPLSAKLLDPTVMELEGKIDRNRLLAISGRSRNVQLQLAKEYNIVNYSAPAGGCILTDSQFSHRLEIFLDSSFDVDSDYITLLRTGRFFKISEDLFLIVGRDQRENELIARFKDKGVYFITTSVPGPEALLISNREDIPEDIIKYAAGICARYADAVALEQVIIEVHCRDVHYDLDISPLEDPEVRNMLVAGFDSCIGK